jgi:glutathione S-transferase
MKLYYHPASTTSRIVQLFALDQGVNLEYQVVDLMSGEHLKPEFARINPNSLVPVLEDGDFRLTESSAILKYLADKAGSPAYPKNLQARAHVNEMMDWFLINFNKDFGYGLLYPQVFAHHRRPGETVQSGTLDWGKQKAQAWLKILDGNLIGPRKAYLCGDAITLADYLGAEILAAGTLIRCSYAAYPNIERWLKNMRGLKSWGKVHEVFDQFAASLRDQSFVAI